MRGKGRHAPRKITDTRAVRDPGVTKIKLSSRAEIDETVNPQGRRNTSHPLTSKIGCATEIWLHRNNLLWHDTCQDWWLPPLMHRPLMAFWSGYDQMTDSKRGLPPLSVWTSIVYHYLLALVCFGTNGYYNFLASSRSGITRTFTNVTFQYPCLKWIMSWSRGYDITRCFTNNGNSGHSRISFI